MIKIRNNNVLCFKMVKISFSKLLLCPIKMKVNHLMLDFLSIIKYHHFG